MIKLILPVFMLLVTGFPALSAEVSIDMLNKLGKERNIYSEKIVYVDVGDTVTWKSKSKGHNVEFIRKNGVPKGVKKFKGISTRVGKF